MSFCIKKWRNARKREFQLEAIRLKGGKCVRCGYSKCLWALNFHHINPQDKEHSIGHMLRSASWERIKKEIDKCELLCANCHMEEHERENVEAHERADKLYKAMQLSMFD